MIDDPLNTFTEEDAEAAAAAAAAAEENLAELSELAEGAARVTSKSFCRTARLWAHER